MGSYGAYPPPTLMKRHLWRVLERLRDELRKNRRTVQGCKYVVDLLTLIAEDQGALRIMAGKAKKPTVSEGWQGFARVQLSDQDKEMFSAWDIEDEDVFVLMADLIGSGYKLSISYSDQNNSFVAALTCRDADSKNAGLTMSAFAQTWYQALRVLMFKHHIVCEGDWSTVADRPIGDIG